MWIKKYMIKPHLDMLRWTVPQVNEVFWLVRLELFLQYSTGERNSHKGHTTIGISFMAYLFLVILLLISNGTLPSSIFVCFFCITQIRRLNFIVGIVYYIAFFLSNWDSILYSFDLKSSFTFCPCSKNSVLNPLFIAQL